MPPNEANVPPTFATVFQSVTSFNNTKTGWVAGAGAEWMATPNILVRAEYLYYNLNSGANASGELEPESRRVPLALQLQLGPATTSKCSELQGATSSERLFATT